MKIKNKWVYYKNWAFAECNTVYVADKEASFLINKYIITCHTDPTYYQQQSIFRRLAYYLFHSMTIIAIIFNVFTKILIIRCIL